MTKEQIYAEPFSLEANGNLNAEIAAYKDYPIPATIGEFIELSEKHGNIYELKEVV